jgi:predicted AAA+ superfamily ATPase
MIKSRSMVDAITPYAESPEAIIVTGMRRTGKTTLLRLLFDRVVSANKIFLDLENPLNRKYFEVDDYDRIIKSFESLGLNTAGRAYVFLDEIQLVRNLPSIIKYCIDHYGTKFFLTGSASFYMKNLFTESLAGRKYIFELFPLSFPEFLAFRESTLRLPAESADITRPVFEKFSSIYEEYLLCGGFPEVVLKSGAAERKKALEDIFSSFFLLEVLQLGDFRRNDLIRDLMLLLMERMGTRLDVQKISRELGVSRPALMDYLAFLEGTYFIQTIKPFSKGRDTEIRKAPKVYVCDCGLAYNLARPTMGALFENAVFQNLRLKGPLNYYQRKSGVEIDFILDKKSACEVKTSPGQFDLRKLKEMSESLGLEDYRIISKNYSEMDHVLYGFMV